VTAYLAGFTAGFRRAAASPGDLAVRLGFFAIILVVMAALWRAALAAHGGELGGYDLRALLWYVFGAQAAVLGVRPRSVEEIGDAIGSGAIAVDMLRPVSVVGMRLASELGEATARVAGAMLVGAAVTWAFAGSPPSTAALALAAPAALLGCACNVASQHAFGGVAFWLADAKSTWFFYQKLVFLPGGMLIPLELLPHALAQVSRWLPFAVMAYVPGRVAAGHPDPRLLLWQAAWLVALLAAAAGVFAAGQRRLEVVGG
jgi:ABC-2 type transport system permease protein